MLSRGCCARIFGHSLAVVSIFAHAVRDDCYISAAA